MKYETQCNLTGKIHIRMAAHMTAGTSILSLEVEDEIDVSKSM